MLSSLQGEELAAVEGRDARLSIRRVAQIDDGDLLEVVVERRGQFVQRLRLTPATAIALAVQLQIAASNLKKAPR